MPESGLAGSRMVVGRTVWDFIIETAKTPGIQLAFMAVMVLIIAMLILIILAFMLHSGLISVRFRYGVFEFLV